MAIDDVRTQYASRDRDEAHLEWAVLGGLLDHRDRLHEVEAVVQPEDFGSAVRSTIYAEVLRQARAGRPPGLVGTPEALIRAGVDAGHVSHLIAIVDDPHHRVVSGGDLVRLAAEVAGMALRRRVLAALRDGMTEVAEAEDPALAGEGVALDLMMLRQGHRAGTRDLEALELVEASIAGLVEREEQRQRGREAGISTGLEALDRLVRLEPGRVYIVAARPGVGKSAFAGHMVRADRGRHQWGIVSLEMGAREWTDRLLCAEACVDVRGYSTGEIEQGAHDRLYDAQPTVSAMRYRIDDRGGLTWAQVESRARQWWMLGQIDALVVDYLQLVRRRDARMSTYDHVSEVSAAAKVLAKDLRVPVVLLAQLNRDVEKRADKRPVPADLRDSGSIEQDADVILMLHREAAHDDDANPEAVEVLVRKNRGGPCGTAPARWLGQFTRFEDAT